MDVNVTSYVQLVTYAVEKQQIVCTSGLSKTFLCLTFEADQK